MSVPPQLYYLYHYSDRTSPQTASGAHNFTVFVWLPARTGASDPLLPDASKENLVIGLKQMDLIGQKMSDLMFYKDHDIPDT